MQQKTDNTEARFKAGDSSALYFLSWFFAAALVFTIITTEVFGEGQDWQNYDSFFDLSRSSGLAADSSERFEIGFRFLSVLLLSLSLSNISVFAAIAALSILTKAAALNVVAKTRLALASALIFNFFCFVPLHEMTQVRAALGIGVLFLGYVCLLRKRMILGFSLLFLAALFHISTVVMIPFFVCIWVFEKKIVAMTRLKSVAIAGLVFVFTLSLIASLFVLFEDFLLIVEAYRVAGFGDDPTNPFSAAILLCIAMCFCGLALWKKQSANMRYILFFQMCGLALFYATLEFPVVAFRLNELVQAFWVFYVADGLNSDDTLVRLSTAGFAIVASAWYSQIYFFSPSFFV